MKAWKVAPTSSDAILANEAIEILAQLEDHRNRYEIEKYNKLLKKLVKLYPEHKTKIYELKIRTDGDGNRASLKDVMKLSVAEKKQEMRKLHPSTKRF
jgi:hypothetical protein